MYPQQVSTATRSDHPHSNRAPWLVDVEHLRGTPDAMVLLSLLRDSRSITGIRFTYRNKQSVTVALDALRWLLNHDCRGIEGSPLPALALKIAQSEYRARTGRKAFGMSFENWMLANA